MENCYLATDRGQKNFEYPVEALMMFMDAMLDEGFSKEEVAQLEEYLIRVRENITLDWELVKKGQKRNYSEVKQ